MFIRGCFNSVLDYLVRRLTGTIPVLLAVAAFVFLFVHMLPGDPARLVAGPDASPQDIAAVRADMGLDRPLIVQFIRYLGQTVQLNLGRSIKTHQTVAELIGERFMPTLLLTVFAMLWSVIVGADRGDVLRACVGAGHQACGIARQQVNEQEDEGGDRQQHRDGAGQPADQVVEHLGN